MLLDPDDQVMRSAAAATAELDGQLVALDVAKGVCFGLNQVATRIWQLIESPATPRSVGDWLLREYEVDEPSCRAQTLALLGELVDVGLAIRAPSAA